MSITIGSYVFVSASSRSVVAGKKGTVLQINPKGFDSNSAEYIVKVGKTVGYVRGKFLTEVHPIEGNYVSVNVDITSNDGNAKCSGLVALCTLVEDDIANIVFQGDFASVHVSVLTDLGPTKPYAFGSV